MARFRRAGITLFAAMFAVLSATGMSVAQAGLTVASPTQSPVLTLDTDRLLNDSAAGRAVDAELADESAALAAENREIEAQLTEEEKSLSTRRATLAPEAFRKEATAFDEKVQNFRTEQDAKLRALQEKSEAARRRILQAANPVLISIMEDTGAVAILDKNSVLVSLQTIDVTPLAIERLDLAMADQPQRPDQTLPPVSPDTPTTSGTEVSPPETSSPDSFLQQDSTPKE